MSDAERLNAWLERTQQEHGEATRNQRRLTEELIQAFASGGDVDTAERAVAAANARVSHLFSRIMILMPATMRAETESAGVGS